MFTGRIIAVEEHDDQEIYDALVERIEALEEIEEPEDYEYFDCSNLINNNN